MSKETSETVVCVTGIAGFVASHIAKILLSQGYSVRGTIRSKKNQGRYQHLLDIQKQFPESKLELFEADLSNQGSFDQVIQGCDFVLHIASPVAFLTSDPMKHVIQPAIDGTLNVLKSCSKSGTVKKVVMTSSVWAVTSWCEDRGKNYKFTDKDWNDHATVKYNPYAFSKKAAEQAAWNYVKDHPDFQLTTIIPGAILGPLLGYDPNLPAPIQLAKAIMVGELITVPNLPLYLVDVRDVAMAHVLAMQKDVAGGQRYICVADKDLWISQVAKKLKQWYPNYPIVSTALPNWCFTLIPTVLARLNEPLLYGKQNTGGWFLLDNAKVKKDLGLTFRDPDESIQECIKTMLANGMVPKKMPLGTINVRVVAVFAVIVLLIAMLVRYFS